MRASTPRAAIGSACTLALTLMLAGCAGMAPGYAPPPLPVPAAYADTGEAAMPGDVRSAASTAWRDYFADPQLQALIALALDHNRDLRLMVLHADEARAAYGIQRADLLPTIGLSASGARSRVPGDLNVTGRPVVGGDYEVGVGLSSWELDFWGRVSSLKDAALENYLASEEARRAATVHLVAQVADAYLALRELDERLAIAQQTVASRRESLRIFRRREQVGATSRLDLLQVETLVTQARSLQVQLMQSRAAQAHALALLVGADAGLPALAPPLRDDAAVMPELRAGLPSDLLSARPDIVAAEHQLKAAHASIGAARAAFFPRVMLTGSLGSASAELDGLFASGSRAWTFVPSVSLPLFDAGRNRAALDLAEVRRELAVANYEKTVQTAFREVADALSARQRLAEQVGVQQEARAAQAERARLAKLRYDNGAAAFLEVLDAQRDLLSAEQQLVQTRRALLSARVGLYAALGGGTQASSSTESTPTP